MSAGAPLEMLEWWAYWKVSSTFSPACPRSSLAWSVWPAAITLPCPCRLPSRRLDYEYGFVLKSGTASWTLDGSLFPVWRRILRGTATRAALPSSGVPRQGLLWAQ
jgi:hypothetical protein